MAIIYSYPVASAVEAGDLVIGTDITGKQTKNFTLQSIADLVGLQGLQSVLDTGTTWTSADGFGTFTIDPGNGDGYISYKNTDADWGYTLSAEEGFYFTDANGNEQGYSAIPGFGGIIVGNTTHSTAITSDNITANRNLYLPDASGTIALTSDITNQGLQSVLTTGNTYISPDGFGVFTLNDLTNKNGEISYTNTDEIWGYRFNAEEGLLFTDELGDDTGKSAILAFGGFRVGNGTYHSLIKSDNITANRVLNLPDADGTVALTSDIVDQGLQSVLDTGREWTSSDGLYEFSLIEGNDDMVGGITYDNLDVGWGYNLNAEEGLNFTIIGGDSGSTYSGSNGYTIKGDSIQAQYKDLSSNGDVYIQETFGNAFTVASRRIWDNIAGQGIQTKFSSNEPGGTLHWQYQNNFAWSVNDTEEVLRIKGDVNGTGKVGIKTTNPQKELDVNGDVKVRGDLDLTGNIFFEQTGGTNIRALIGTTSTSPNCDIEIGQTGTSIIEGINLKPGDAGGIVDIYNNTSVAARFKSARLVIGDLLDVSKTMDKTLDIQDNDPFIRLENSIARKLDFWVDPNSPASYIATSGGNDRLNLSTGGSDRIHIANDGSIGIGTTNPGSILEIVEPTNKAELKVTVLSDEDTAVSFENPNRIFKAGYDTSKDVFKIAVSSFNSKNFTIAPGGNCGIGTDAPSRDLHIASSTAAIELENTSQSDCFINFKNPGRTFKVGYDDSSDVWKVAKSTFGDNALTVNGDDGRVGLGTQTTDPSAILELDSDEQGFLMPRLTTAEINAISSPATGLAVYNTSLNTICFYDGRSWKKVNSSNM